jgi:hydroxyethylthiazole kinase-like uncharacterized protein yjeF
MSLPDFLDPLFDAEEMGAADAYASEEGGVPSLVLMERAAEGLARATAEIADRQSAAGRGGPIAVLVGKGNNGGDGLAAARLLREEGREVDVIALGDLEELEGDAAANRDRLPPPEPRGWDEAGEDALGESAVIVDALLGTGFSGEPREPMASAIRAMNEAEAPVVACDVPSGVDGSTGEVHGDAVEADLTTTFHARKLGLYVAPGAFHSGEVRTVAIGIPRDAPGAEGAGLITERAVELYPSRPRHGSKFTAGVVVIVGGSLGLTGAPTMAALAAMRTGAGYVQLAVPGSTEQVFALELIESMTKGLPEEDGAHVPDGADDVKELAERAGGLVLGPGIGRSEGALEFARRVAREVEAPLVIDADGLNAHAEDLESLAGRPAPAVLTPHDGELGRLLGRESDEVSAHRLQSARDAAARSECIVVLKGDDTIVAQPDGPTAVSPGASPALATAGTGDVLSGVIATLLAKGLEPFAAACAGVLAHARAGQLTAKRFGADHVIASDVIDSLPEAISRARFGDREGRRLGRRRSR